MLSMVKGRARKTLKPTGFLVVCGFVLGVKGDRPKLLVHRKGDR